MQRIIVMAGDSLGGAALEQCWEGCTRLATDLGENILLATIDEQLLPVSELVFGPGMVSHGEIVRPLAPSGAGMSSAPFVWREDGRPDWGAMWTDYCELALHGGPPHRGEESALLVSDAPAAAPCGGQGMVEEIARGIYETTRLHSRTAGSGWLAVGCESPRMAAWLCAAIILENVDARADGCDLLVPARPDYRLENEVKSVITVVAKTHHYWQQHVLPAAACSVDRGAWRAARARHAHAP
jgi:hypothetical protein